MVQALGDLKVFLENNWGKISKTISSKANMYFKVQFESPKLQHQTTFETLKPCSETTYLSEKM
jgi:hypothetical protein